jgi:hypothetical protein
MVSRSIKPLGPVRRQKVIADIEMLRGLAAERKADRHARAT